MKTETPIYFEALGLTLRRGRFYCEEDLTSAPSAIVLNEAAARHFFGTDDPVGKTAGMNNSQRTIVGVVADVPQHAYERPPVPEVYLPLASQPVGSGFLAIRTTAEPYRVLPAVRAAAFGVLPNVPLRFVATMGELVAGQTAERRVAMLTFALFGVLGLVIATVGVYGVMAYVVAQRTREIGVRVALGATRGEVVGLVLKQAGALAAAGVVIGGVAAWSLGHTVSAFLFGMDGQDLRALGLAVTLLPLGALIASAVPARRAASVDPTLTLRSE